MKKIKIHKLPVLKLILPLLARAFYFGFNYYCPICKSRLRRFLNFGADLRKNVLCPVCYSLERHRLMWLYFQQKTDLFSENNKILHFAPENSFLKRFKKMSNLQYLTADLDQKEADICMDITDIKFPDNSFDVVLCSHVLEHVKNDQKALKEIYRVLKPNGWALLQVPIDLNLEKTLEEDEEGYSPQKRAELFGLPEHVRQYGADYADRLASAGFRVKVDNYINTLSKELIEKYSLPLCESIYICYKQ